MVVKILTSSIKISRSFTKLHVQEILSDSVEEAEEVVRES